MAPVTLPPLHPEYESTRASLHAYSQAIGAIARAHGTAHPKWWHISLKPRPEGLATDPISLPGGGSIAITMNLRRGEIVTQVSNGDTHRIDIGTAPTAASVAESLAATAAGYGLGDEYDHEHFPNDSARTYDAQAAGAYFDAFTAVAGVFSARRATLGERVSPVQLWPHGFDISFEWFGTRTVEHDGDTLSAQLNLGFYPGGDEPYFYSSPWPFEPALADRDLPDGAYWNTDGWNGAALPYRFVRESNDPEQVIHRFAAAVFTAARPTLEAP